MYVSDRRLVKAVALMQVAAYTSGRSRVAEYDCLLLRHILWQRPDEAERIYDWLLRWGSPRGRLAGWHPCCAAAVLLPLPLLASASEGVCVCCLGKAEGARAAQ